MGARTLGATATAFKHNVQVNVLEHLTTALISQSEVAVSNLVLDAPVPFDGCRDVRGIGGCILIDRISLGTVSAGMVDFALPRAHNSARARWKWTAPHEPHRWAKCLAVSCRRVCARRASRHL